MKNIMEARQALTEKPLFSTSAERFQILDAIKSQYKELPQPLRFARFLGILLDRISVPLEDYDLIAGRCVDRLLTDGEEAQFQQFLRHPDYPAKKVMLSSGHCSYDWALLLRHGLPGLRNMVQERLRTEQDPDKITFLTAMVQIYDALIRYLLRYAAAAKQRGMEKLAQTLTDAAEKQPDTFRTALQLFWIVTMIDCSYITENPTLTVGRLDQLLFPLYEADLRSGRLTREEAEQLITDYYCKHNLNMGRGEHQIGDASNSTTFQRILNFDAPQYLLLAGTDETGQPAVNELTLLFARCIQPEFKNPVVVVRYFRDLNTQYPELWKTLAEKSLQSASLMYYNDDNVLQTFAKLGIPEEDAREYIHFGCNWPSLGPKSEWIQGGPAAEKYDAFLSEEEPRLLSALPMRMEGKYGWADLVTELLREEKDNENFTMERLYDRFFGRMEKFLEKKLELFALDVSIRQRKPSAVLTFGDCFYESSIRKGECFSASAQYHFSLQSFYMFGTVADCFTVVDQLVCRERAVTLAQLLEATEHNFEGYPAILARCRNVPKYGSDSALSNFHARELARRAMELLAEKNKPYLERMNLFLTPCIQSDTWNLKYGLQCGATVDGRLAGTAFSHCIRPANGAATEGLTAMLNAVSALPRDCALSGAMNLDVSPRDFAGEAGKARFAALLGTYLNRGGLHAQVTCADGAQLREAQLHPEQHRDLRVRVTGYSGIFVDVPKKLQDDIIERLQ